jgi:hypothetical protein
LNRIIKQKYNLSVNSLFLQAYSFKIFLKYYIVAKKPNIKAAVPTEKWTMPTNEITPTNTPKWLYPAITLFFLAIIGFARTNLLSLPFERDEGYYSYMGKLLLEGGRPYIDFYEMKLPGLFYGYASVVAFFGGSVESMHLGFGIINFISAFLVWHIAKHLFNDLAAMAATVSFAILSLNKSASGFAAQGEHLVVLFAALGILFTVKGISSGKIWQYVLAGAALSMAMMIKQSGVFFAVGAGAMVVLADTKPFNFFKIAKNAASMIGGFLAIVGVFLLLMIKNGAYEQMNYFVFEVAQEYVKSLDFNFGMERLRGSLTDIIKGYTGYWTLGFLGVVLPWLTSLDFYKKLGISVLAVAAFASVTPGLRFYGHYYMQFMLGLSLLIAAGIYSIGAIMEERMKVSSGKIAATVLFILFTIVVISGQKDYYFSPNNFKTIREVYGDNPFAETKAIADYIKANSRDNSPIAVFGSEPQIYFETGRKCVSRHSFIGFTSPMNDVAKGWREEFKADVETSKPEYLILVAHQFSWLFPPDSDQDLFKWGFNYARQNQYEMVGVADILPGSKPTLIWDAAAATYKPKGEKYVYVFRKK